MKLVPRLPCQEGDGEREQEHKGIRKGAQGDAGRSIYQVIFLLCSYLVFIDQSHSKKVLS